MSIIFEQRKRKADNSIFNLNLNLIGLPRNYKKEQLSRYSLEKISVKFKILFFMYYYDTITSFVGF